MSGRLAGLFVNEAGEVRALWRVLLFLPLFLVASAVARGLLGPVSTLRDLPGAAVGAGALLVGAVAAGAVMLAAVDRRPPGALGFAFTLRVPGELALGIGLAAVGLGVVVAALWLAGRFGWTPDAGTPLTYADELVRDLVLWGIAAAAEEALFRGYAFQVLVQGIGAAPATLLASAAFALAHGDNPEVDTVALLNIFLAGVLLSVAYLRTRSLWFATAVHMGWNWMMGTVLALPVSGLVLVDTPLYDGHPGGPRWLTGGGFGPEGGLVATLAFLLILAAVAALPLHETARMRELRPLVDTRLTR